MKKSHVYFVAPLAGLVVFAGIYWKYSSTYEAKLEASAAAQRKVRDDKIMMENLSKKKAIEDAIAAQNVRKKQKADKEAKAQEDSDNRDRAVQARNKAREDARKFADQAKRLEKEVDENKKQIAKLEADKKHSVEEQAFLRQYVPKAEANQKALAAVLEKIAAADKAAEEAARAAAIAAAAAAAAKKK